MTTSCTNSTIVERRSLSPKKTGRADASVQRSRSSGSVLRNISRNRHGGGGSIATFDADHVETVCKRHIQNSRQSSPVKKTNGSQSVDSANLVELLQDAHSDATSKPPRRYHSSDPAQQTHCQRKMQSVEERPRVILQHRALGDSFVSLALSAATTAVTAATAATNKDKMKFEIDSPTQRPRVVAASTEADDDSSTVLSSENMTDEQRLWVGIARMLTQTDSCSVLTTDVIPPAILHALRRRDSTTSAGSPPQSELDDTATELASSAIGNALRLRLPELCNASFSSVDDDDVKSVLSYLNIAVQHKEPTALHDFLGHMMRVVDEEPDFVSSRDIREPRARTNGGLQLPQRLRPRAADRDRDDNNNSGDKDPAEEGSESCTEYDDDDPVDSLIDLTRARRQSTKIYRTMGGDDVADEQRRGAPDDDDHEDDEIMEYVDNDNENESTSRSAASLGDGVPFESFENGGDFNDGSTGNVNEYDYYYGESRDHNNLALPMQPMSKRPSNSTFGSFGLSTDLEGCAHEVDQEPPSNSAERAANSADFYVPQAQCFSVADGGYCESASPPLLEMACASRRNSPQQNDPFDNDPRAEGFSAADGHDVVSALPPWQETDCAPQRDPSDNRERRPKKKKAPSKKVAAVGSLDRTTPTKKKRSPSKKIAIASSDQDCPQTKKGAIATANKVAADTGLGTSPDDSFIDYFQKATSSERSLSSPCATEFRSASASPSRYRSPVFSAVRRNNSKLALVGSPFLSFRTALFRFARKEPATEPTCTGRAEAQFYPDLSDRYDDCDGVSELMLLPTSPGA